MNPQIVISTTSKIPYIAAGIALVALVSFVILKINASKPLPTDDKKEPVIIWQALLMLVFLIETSATPGRKQRKWLKGNFDQWCQKE